MNFSGTAGRIISERSARSDREIVVLFRRSKTSNAALQRAGNWTSSKTEAGKERRCPSFRRFVYTSSPSGENQTAGSNWIVWDCLIPPWRVMRIIWPWRGYCARQRAKMSDIWRNLNNRPRHRIRLFRATIVMYIRLIQLVRRVREILSDNNLTVPELYRDIVGKYWIGVTGVRSIQVERHG